MRSSTVQVISLDILRKNILPAIAIGQELLLVVQQLLMVFNRKLEVRSFHDGIHRACLLAEATVNALGHIDVVLSRTATVVTARLSFDGDRLCWADGFAQLTGNAALFAGGISSQGVLATEAWADGAFLEWVVDRQLGLHGNLQGLHEPTKHLGEHQLPGRKVQNALGVESLRGMNVALPRRKATILGKETD